MISRDKEVQLYHNAINIWGASMQTIVAIEEFNELILALTNLKMSRESNVEEETADAEIMINQICIINDIELFSDIPCKPVEVNVSQLSNEAIISLTQLTQAVTKGIRGEKVDLRTKLVKAWSYIQFLKAVLGDEVDKYKEAKLQRLSQRVCM